MSDANGVSIDLTALSQHGGTIRSASPLTVESPRTQWSYAVSLPVQPIEQGLPVVMVAHVVVQEGKLGALVVASDLKTAVARIPPPVGPGRHSMEIVLETFTPGSRFVLRNNTSGGRPCIFTLEGIDLRPAGPEAPGSISLLKTVTEGDPPRVALSKLRRAIAPRPGEIQRIVDGVAVDIVDVSALDRRLCFPTPLEYPETSRRKSFFDWKMEDDDAPILRYLYRHFRPHRHLEFGTWSGNGACYCLEECAATVWTINLAEGELIDGAPAYTAAIDDAPEGVVPFERVDGGAVYQTDAGMLIGRRYREAGFGHRVCQIYCDSRKWDTSAYPRGFFDSVLIDGGHSEEVVLSDTRKALAVTRPGALVMWHDFCPDPAVFDALTSVVGVLTALTGHWDEIAPSLKDVFWVQPSFLLIGIRR